MDGWVGRMVVGRGGLVGSFGGSPRRGPSSARALGVPLGTPQIPVLGGPLHDFFDR